MGGYYYDSDGLSFSRIFYTDDPSYRVWGAGPFATFKEAQADALARYKTDLDAVRLSIKKIRASKEPRKKKRGAKP